MDPVVSSIWGVVGFIITFGGLSYLLSGNPDKGLFFIIMGLVLMSISIGSIIYRIREKRREEMNKLRQEEKLGPE